MITKKHSSSLQESHQNVSAERSRTITLYGLCLACFPLARPHNYSYDGIANVTITYQVVYITGVMPKTT